MKTFVPYLDPSISLDQRLEDMILKLGICQRKRAELRAFMHPLKVKDLATYEHSVRVGLLAWTIGKVMHLDPKALFYSGLLHDIGKAQTNPATLKKTDNWTEADTQEVMRHVMDGYHMLRDHFDFSAEIILWHHKFQPNSYPKEIPDPLHNYDKATRAVIPLLGRVLALADQFDALHRVNSKFAATDGPVGEVVMHRMFEDNPDQRELIGELYELDVFTTRTFEDAPVTS